MTSKQKYAKHANCFRIRTKNRRIEGDEPVGGVTRTPTNPPDCTWYFLATHFQAVPYVQNLGHPECVVNKTISAGTDGYTYTQVFVRILRRGDRQQMQGTVETTHMAR
jgi:hypothetical protein